MYIHLFIRATLLILLSTALFFPKIAFAHPQGNLITIDQYVLWTYVDPVDDPRHHACVMIWDREQKPRVLLTSVHVGSDYYLYTDGKMIYYIEARNEQGSGQVFFRVLKGLPGTTPSEIWPWQEDHWRVGNGGFFMAADKEIVFTKYPNLYRIRKGETAVLFKEFTDPVVRLRKLQNGELLLLSETSCSRLDENYRLLQRWEAFIDQEVQNAPLGRNQIFDMDYIDQELLLAYWGKHSFEVISSSNKIQQIVQEEVPYVPHWVAIQGEAYFLFSSSIDPPAAIRPRLIRIKNGQKELIWDGQ